jgi:GT2 family glycosyltransferase
MTSLAIVIVNGSTIKTNTVLCLLDAFAQTPVEKHVIAPIGGYPHHSRTLVVDTARKHHASHILFIDNDMIFPPDAITRLLAHRKEIVGANYHERGLPLTATVKLADAAGNLLKGREEDFPKELFPCFALPTGFLLIEMGVFERLEKPYFDLWDKGEFCTEDFYFCKKAGKAGIGVWCDPTLKIYHIGDYMY